MKIDLGRGLLRGNCVFASTTSDNEYFHVSVLLLVSKVALAGKYHRDSKFVTGRDDFIITFRTARLNYRDDARFARESYTVVEWKESIAAKE